MAKDKIPNKRKPLEYIPVVNKQIRWISARQIAENFYHSKLTDEQIILVLGTLKTKPELIFSIFDIS